MTTPFTIEHFLEVFVSCNAAVWPAQVATYVLGPVAFASARLQRPPLRAFS